MASHSDIAHRWANKDFGRNGSLNGRNCYCNERSFYSYNTVVGQWLDKDKDIMAIIDVNLSKTTSKHVGHLIHAVPKGVKVFYFHLPGSCYDWYENVELLGRRDKFDAAKRMQLVKLWIDNLYESFTTIKESRSLQDEKIEMKWWEYILELNEMYNNDASPKKYLRTKIHSCLSKENRALEMNKRKMVRGLLEGLSKEEIVDSLCGKGTWKAWEERVAPLRKAEHTRYIVRKINQYLHAGDWMGNPTYSQKDIKNMSPSQMMQVKFRNIERKSEKYKLAQEHKQNSMKRAMSYIGIKKRDYTNYVDRVVSHFTGETIYDCSGGNFYTLTDKADIHFNANDFKNFCEAQDKRAWLHRFYQLCELKQRRILGNRINGKIKCGLLSVDSLSPEELQAYNEYKIRETKREDEAREQIKAMELERQRREEERLAMERAKAQKIEEYRNSGIDGLRNLWRENLTSIPHEAYSNSEYFYGGNVLLRLKDENTLETSEGIRLSKDICKKFWRIIVKWHNNPSSFSPMTINTQCGQYKISEYSNDILTAGCHEIAFTEMQNAAVKLGFVKQFNNQKL